MSIRVVRTTTYIDGYGFVDGEPKSAKSRRNIALPQFVVDALKRPYMSQSEERLAAGATCVDLDLVFPDKDGDYLLSVTLLRRFRKLLKEIGLPRIRFHDLSHSAATLLLSMGVDMKVIQELLGHSSIKITADIYAHVLLPMHKEAMDKMNSFFDSSSQ